MFCLIVCWFVGRSKNWMQSWSGQITCNTRRSEGCDYVRRTQSIGSDCCYQCGPFQVSFPHNTFQFCFIFTHSQYHSLSHTHTHAHILKMIWRCHLVTLFICIIVLCSTECEIWLEDRIFQMITTNDWTITNVMVLRWRSDFHSFILKFFHLLINSLLFFFLEFLSFSWVWILCSQVNLCLKALPKFTCLPYNKGQFGTTTHILPQNNIIEALRRGFNDMRAGKLSEFPTIEWYIHSTLDPSIQDRTVSQFLLSLHLSLSLSRSSLSNTTRRNIDWRVYWIKCRSFGEGDQHHNSALFVQWVPYELTGTTWEKEEERYVRDWCHFTVKQVHWIKFCCEQSLTPKSELSMICWFVVMSSICCRFWINSLPELRIWWWIRSLWLRQKSKNTLVLLVDTFTTSTTASDSLIGMQFFKWDTSHFFSKHGKLHSMFCVSNCVFLNWNNHQIALYNSNSRTLLLQCRLSSGRFSHWYCQNNKNKNNSFVQIIPDSWHCELQDVRDTMLQCVCWEISTIKYSLSILINRSYEYNSIARRTRQQWLWFWMAPL
jgi:hypothetical protein